MKARKRPPSHPGRIIKGLYLEQFSITISDLAKALGVSRKTLSKIVNERGSISSGMALRLSRAFNTSPELWLNLQRNYDLWHASHNSNDWKNVRPVKRQVNALV
jgi:addiction module HigA family antidote